MRVKIISILLTFFIFVIVSPAMAGNVKSTKDTPNRETEIKVDKNRVRFLKSKGPARQPATSFKKLNAKFQSTTPYLATDAGAIMGTAIFCVNFLKILEETKKLRLTDSLYKAVYSYELFRDPWKDRPLSSGEINRRASSNSNLGQSIPKPYVNPNGDSYFEEGRIRSTLKLLQLKREEVFNEIFMGFRFSFGSKSTPMLVEMNISPFPEKGPGVIIAF